MVLEDDDNKNERTAHTVPVERLRGGDHSCLTVTDSETPWQVLTAHTWTGLAKGEKVLIVMDPSDLSDDEAVARMDGGSGRVETARDSGQVVFNRNTSVYLPDGRFDMRRQLTTNAAVNEDAHSEGWPGLRYAADMSWALRPGVDGDMVVDYEATVAELFANRDVTAICWYDQLLFADYFVAAVRGVHPLQVMERLDAIDVKTTPTGGRIAGSAEPSTREEFVKVLRETLERPTGRGAAHFELDLTDLCFMEAHCAGQLISFAAGLPDDSTLTIHCGPLHDLVLHGLGAATVPQLRIRVEEERAEARI